MIAGLGNPGEGYARTRHNIGFLVADAVALKAGLSFNKNKFDASYVKSRIKGSEVVLAKPMAYMNRSGFPIQRLASFYKVRLEDILIVHDDMDLPFGVLKINQSRGHGGHNGIRSVIDAFGSNAFSRIRVGVGHPGGREAVTGHVLGRFSPEEQSALNDTIEAAAKACHLVLGQGIVKAMNRINSRR